MGKGEIFSKPISKLRCHAKFQLPIEGLAEVSFFSIYARHKFGNLVFFK